MHKAGVEGDYYGVVVDFYGTNLEILRANCNNRFTLGTAMLLGEQMAINIKIKLYYR